MAVYSLNSEDIQVELQLRDIQIMEKYNLSVQQLFDIDMAIQFDAEPEDFGISCVDYFGHPRPEVVAGPVLAPPTFGG